MFVHNKTFDQRTGCFELGGKIKSVTDKWVFPKTTLSRLLPSAFISTRDGTNWRKRGARVLDGTCLYANSSERRFHLFQAASNYQKHQHSLKSGLLHCELFEIVVIQIKESKLWYASARVDLSR